MLTVFLLLIAANGLKTVCGVGIAVAEAFVEGAERCQLFGHDPDGL
ncbi:MAG: hypothetical protein JST42_22500 [Bacteroidetes bacterium]|nr:hypothetical protein [Bacteroidota bacterium]